MRLFTAVILSPNMQKALIDAQNSLRQSEFSGRYTDVRNLHLTLVFIGEYSDPEAILEILEQISFMPFPLTLSGYIGNFGNLLWAGTERNPSLEQYVRQIRHALAEAGIPFDKKRFHPHITLLRNAQSRRSFAEIRVCKERMTVRGISLMRSDFGKHGAEYTEIGRVEQMKV